MPRPQVCRSWSRSTRWTRRGPTPPRSASSSRSTTSWPRSTAATPCSSTSPRSRRPASTSCSRPCWSRPTPRSTFGPTPTRTRVVPRAGDTFLVAPDDRTARQIAEKREAAERAAQLAKRRKRISLEDFTQALQLGKVETLNLVLKGDVSGAVEALEDALLKIDVGEEVELRVIHRGVGAITQNDVNLATVD